jgi:hypothetical protein
MRRHWFLMLAGIFGITAGVAIGQTARHVPAGTNPLRVVLATDIGNDMHGSRALVMLL